MVDYKRLITFDSTSLLAKNCSVNENISNESFSAFCFQMFNFLMNASILDFSVKNIGVFSLEGQINFVMFFKQV